MAERIERPQTGIGESGEAAMQMRDMRRIQVYADAETKRRIELAAAKHNLPVTSYCLDAIMQQLSEDDVLEQERIEVPIKPTARALDAKLIAQMRTLREKIKARRGGALITTDIVEQVRSERDEELNGPIKGIAGLR